ncbi:hypothetical protein BASA81_001615 [Batrachochytrium salamandrivorans]|nr:hypothetical protein BASA81_001615 [Batrachochytrium salamandrivorans]
MTKPTGRPAKQSRRDSVAASSKNRWPNQVHLWGKHNAEWRECEVLESRCTQATALLEDESKREYLYYVHYVDFNRRMDAWLPSVELSESHPEDASREFAFKLDASKNKGVIEFVEEEYGDDAMSQDDILAHEKLTKIKNVSNIQLGKGRASTWYFTPIPGLCSPNQEVVECLYFCEFCLDYFLTDKEVKRHEAKCVPKHPPGDEIYRDPDSRLAFFEVDGARSVVYCQNLAYLAKCFLDHKSLIYDTDVFFFYVLCEIDAMDPSVYHMVGYFSKEKYSEVGYNLACILTLPQYQKRGFGTCLISFSYELSKKEEKVGSPEKPLSDLGQLGYRSYWSNVLLDVLKSKAQENSNTAYSISILDLSLITAIKAEDIVSTLDYWKILKQHPDTNEVYLDSSPAVIEACLGKLGDSHRRAPKIRPELLFWAPYRERVLRQKDPWLMRSKLRQFNKDFVES